jgi:hypothetical protein
MSERGIAGVWSSGIWIETETGWRAGAPKWGGLCAHAEARRWAMTRNAAAAAA